MLSSASRLDTSYLYDPNTGAKLTQFDQPSPKWENWDLNFPYSLVVVAPGMFSSYKILERIDLPINPEAIRINTPFAINFSPTMSGIIEQHAGMVTSNIAISGTTGVLPIRKTIESGWGLLDTAGGQLATTFFGSTIAAGQSLANNISRVLDSDSSPIIITDKEILPGFFRKGFIEESGYSHFINLRNFLESYVTYKKRSDAGKVRLGFVMWKDDLVYLVTPQMFSLKRSADSPYEYQYDLQMLGWSRFSADDLWVNFKTSKNSGILGILGGLVKAFKIIVNVLRSASTIVKQAFAVIRAFGADLYNNIIGPLNDIYLAAKLFLNIDKTFSDEMDSIKNDFGRVLRSWNSVNQSTIPPTEQNKGALVALNAAAAEMNGTSNPNGTYDVPSNQKLQAIKDKVRYIFEDPDTYKDLFDNITLTPGMLSKENQRRSQQRDAKLKSLTRLDYERYRDQLLAGAAVYANAVGASNDSYNATYGITSPKQTIRNNPTANDMAFLGLLNDMATQISNLAVASSESTNSATPALMDTVAVLAGKSGIQFNIPTSRYPVPFPYGSTLEQIATTYLGDPNRWMEIATLNELRAPFVDELGFEVSLTGNGATNKVIVGSATDLAVGQTVWLKSNTVSVTKRQITEILELSPYSWQISLDGDSNLSVYTTADSASFHTFKPHTVNSQMMLYVPSLQAPTGTKGPVKDIPGVDALDKLLDIGGIDLLLGSDNDLVIPTDGSGRYSAGLVNLIQQLKLILTTTRGEIVQHPNIGGSLVGSILGDISAADIANQVKQILKSDETFGNFDSQIKVDIKGPAVEIQIAMNIIGTKQYVPVKIVLPR